MSVQQFINRYIFSSISEGMCVPLFDDFNGYSLVKK